MNDLIDISTYTELAIFECGREECVKSKVINLKIKNYYLFHYVLYGKGTLVIHGKEYRLNKGCIFYIPKNTSATYFPDKEDPWIYEWVGFSGTEASKYLDELNLSADNPIIQDEHRIYKKYFDTIVSRYINSGYLDLTSLGGLYQLFGEMIYDKEGDAKKSKTYVIVRLAKDFIKHNYQFDITIDDIAKNANVTPNYLSSIFQKEEKMTTKKYLTKMRMTKAMEFLESGNYKIGEVASMVGYPNQLHFSSEFKKYYGNSPLNYLKK